MGVPMLALAWPAHWLALVPVIALEAAIGVRAAGIPIKQAVKVATFGNLWSTFIGVPVVWALLFGVEMVFGLALSQIDPSGGDHWFLFPIFAAWLGPSANVWTVYAAFVILAVPFCIGSIWIETRVGMQMCPSRPAAAIRAWIQRANIWSYVLLSTIAVAFPLFGE
jgi:hypothetical protein